MKTETNQKSKNMSKEQKVKQALALLEQGYTRKQTAKKIGITEKTLRNWLQQYRPTKALLNETAFLLLETIYKKLENRILEDWELSEFTKNVFMLSNVLGKNAKDGYIKSIERQLTEKSPEKQPEKRPNEQKTKI